MQISCSKQKKLLEIQEVAKKLPSNLWKALYRSGWDSGPPNFNLQSLDQAVTSRNKIRTYPMPDGNEENGNGQTVEN